MPPRSAARRALPASCCAATHCVSALRIPVRLAGHLPETAIDMNPSTHSFASWIRIGVGVAVAAVIGSSIHLADLSAQAPGQVPVPIPGRNINMVSGTTLPGGDPFLQRQNEPSIAVSTRNPLHILGAANDYRTVDIPGLGEEVIGDAWIGIFKSFDGGSTWKSTLLPGFRQDVTSRRARHSPLYGLEAGADPVHSRRHARPVLLAGMAFNRDQDAGRVFVARYIDNNNLEAGDSIAYLNTTDRRHRNARSVSRQAVDRRRHSARHEGPRPQRRRRQGRSRQVQGQEGPELQEARQQQEHRHSAPPDQRSGLRACPARHSRFPPA